MMSASAAIADLHFRPPAIPLITADPFMQTWIWGDNSTAGSVRHWDGVAKDMLGIIRVDGAAYSFLGECHRPPVAAPGPVNRHEHNNVAPGMCDIGSSANHGDTDCNERCYSNPSCAAYVLDSHRCWLKSCSSPLVPTAGSNGSVLTGPHPPCDVNLPSLVQRSVVVYPTRTQFALELPGTVSLTLTFLHPAFTDDLTRLSRPTYYVHHTVVSLDRRPHSVQLYLDASAAHAVNDCAQQTVGWSEWSSEGLRGIQIGSEEQRVLGSKGDRVNIDWGYLHVACDGCSLRAGSAAVSRRAFVTTGQLNAANDTRQPRTCLDDLPALASAVDLGAVGAAGANFTALLAYDDIRSVYYFGREYSGLWRRTYRSIQEALVATAKEFAAMRAKSEAHDEALLTRLLAVGGAKYAALCALSYRQTLGALKPVWVDDRAMGWTFLKEISTNGDMNTMDVVYPASPMLLYTAPELLRQLLLPVLAYAHNETYIRFSDPYSPHQARRLRPPTLTRRRTPTRPAHAGCERRAPRGDAAAAVAASPPSHRLTHPDSSHVAARSWARTRSPTTPRRDRSRCPWRTQATCSSWCWPSCGGRAPRPPSRG